MTYEELIEILTNLHPDVDFENTEGLIDDMIIDSFDIISLITELNSDYDITIPPSKIVPEYFNSAKSLFELIQQIEDEE